MLDSLKTAIHIITVSWESSCCGAKEDVIGVITDTGEAIVCHKSNALETLMKGEEISHAYMQHVADEGGVKARDKQDNDLGGH